jgi:hypothetical protein
VVVVRRGGGGRLRSSPWGTRVCGGRGGRRRRGGGGGGGGPKTGYRTGRVAFGRRLRRLGAVCPMKRGRRWSVREARGNTTTVQSRGRPERDSWRRRRWMRVVAVTLIDRVKRRRKRKEVSVRQTDMEAITKPKTRHDTTRHDTTRHDTTRHDTTRHDTTRHTTTHHNTRKHNTRQHTHTHENVIVDPNKHNEEEQKRHVILRAKQVHTKTAS